MGNEVRVGTGVIVVRDGKMLVGRRKGSHAAGLYSFPGGHLDFGETWAACVLRELEEECGEGMKVRVRSFEGGLNDALFITNDIMPQYDKHYVTIFMVADWIEGEPVNMEPHKCDGWEWVTFEELLALADNDKCAGWIPKPQLIANRRRLAV